ncbi:MAG: hypothetical protein HYU66_11025 [Armatimonadetes bacterium]|nr:hypothetical protein [Armatimonadota bacterium]
MRSVTLPGPRCAWALACAGLLAAFSLGLFGCGGAGKTALDLGGSAVDALQTSTTTGALEARLVNAAGNPLADQNCTLNGSARQVFSLALTTDALGVLRAGNLPPGDYTINAAGNAFTSPVAAGQITTRRFSAADPTHPRSDLGLLYVVNGLAKTLSVVDTDSRAATNNVINTGEAPNQVLFDRGIGYVVNSLSNNVQRFNPTTNQAIDNIATGTGTNPFYLAMVSPTKAYVSNLLTNTIAVVNLATSPPSVTGTIPNVGTSPEGMLLVNGRMYVCATGFSFIGFTYGPGQVHVIDTATDTLQTSIPTGDASNPQAMVLGADGMIYVLASGAVSFDPPDFIANPAGSQVLRIDPSTNQIVGPPLDLTGSTIPNSNCGAIALAPNGLAFLSDSSSNMLHVINTANATVVRTGAQGLPAGNNPLGVAVSANGRVWAFNFGDDTVSCFDASTLASVGAPVALGDGPQTGVGRAEAAGKATLEV